MAMIFGADVIAVSQRVTRRNPNIVRIGCDSNEDIFLASRLSEQQLQALARDFFVILLVNILFRSK